MAGCIPRVVVSLERRAAPIDLVLEFLLGHLMWRVQSQLQIGLEIGLEKKGRLVQPRAGSMGPFRDRGGQE
jgi:hypothetical protein